MKPISKSEISQFITLSSSSGYNFSRKEQYRKLGKKILKYIAQEMNLSPGKFEIRWNPGGIACSGDHILHTDKVYLALHDNLNSGWFYYRSVKGLKDYTGGKNQIVRWQSIKNGLEPLIEALKVIQTGGYNKSGDFIMTPHLVEQNARSMFT